MNDPRAQAIALAGTAQSALWVEELARKSLYRSARVEAAIDAVLCLNPESADAVYGGMAGIDDGIRVLRAQLGRDTGKLETGELAVITRYMGQLLRLSVKVRKNRGMLDTLSQELEQTRQARAMGMEPETLRARLADIYSRTVSTLSPRVMVQGNPANLENQGFVESIRLFLLMGVRSGVLWRQCGGRMWHLLLQRRALLSQVQRLKDGV